jgi:hypothetical protein
MATQVKLINSEMYMKRNTDGSIDESIYVIINNVPYTNDLTNLLERLAMKSDGNTLSLIPTCSCGKMTGGYLENSVCRHCNTVVKKPYESDEPSHYFKAIDETGEFISPIFYYMCNRAFQFAFRTKSSTKQTLFNTMRWLSDPNYRPKKDMSPPPYLHEMASGFPRDYKTLKENLGYYLGYALNYYESQMSGIRPKETNHAPKNELKNLINLWNTERDKILSNYMPLPNSDLIILEATKSKIYSTQLYGKVSSIVLDFINIYNDYKDEVDVEKKRRLGIKLVSNLTSNMIEVMIEMYTDIIDQKSGVLRKNIYGTRENFNFRFVITPLLYGDYNHVHVPYLTGLTTYRFHVISKLMNSRNFTYKQADKFITENTITYNPIIGEILKELIRDAAEINGVGLPILISRNPTLHRGSYQLVYITVFKEDVSDVTMSLHITIVQPFNADFDGDEMNAYVLLSENFRRLAMSYAPENNVPDSQTVDKVSDLIEIPKPQIATISNFVNGRPNEVIEGDNTILNKLNSIEVK